MDYLKIKKELKNYELTRVDLFVDYLKKLETDKDSKGQLKAWWVSKVSEDEIVSLYKKVALDNLWIDGNTITLQWKGGLMVSYNFQAYKNKLLQIYPEAMFDVQLVYSDDKFSFKKESGHVKYEHTITNPFELQKDIIGAYCVIKTNRGEFLETLNMDEIMKMKNVAKTKTIWDAWEGEMILKSVMKRSCKRHFNDVVQNMEELDGENYELDKVELSSEIQKEIDSCQSRKELGVLYKKYKDKVDETTLLKDIGERQEELNQMQTS